MLVKNSTLAALLLAIVLLSLPARAQQSGSGGSDQTQPAQTNPRPADGNAFPEDTSRKAAQDKAAQDKKDAGSEPATATVPAQGTPKADENAFPEETSRKAAEDAKAASSNSGVSSSSDYDARANGGRNAVEPNAAMPHIRVKDLVKEDLQVGSFYLQSCNYKGAYARFKEASSLRPENTDAIFGLAEAARHLDKHEEALQNYQLFLDIVPSGAKARDARKALSLLARSGK